ncbi:MAG TPA: hypothetical protein VMT00_03570 [Thermoanaerobaculia bacterium]|nr:hypothetical protein [Thermoanaerobaculia bacterium]
MSPPVPLTLIAVGNVTAENVSELTPFFEPIEQIDLPLERGAVLSESKGEVNRALAAAASPWILILRNRETVSAPLASEIFRAVTSARTAWAYRIRSLTLYRNRPLELGPARDEGEVRLVHQRHCRFDPRLRGSEMKVEGPVIRLHGVLESRTFASSLEHRNHLERKGVPHSLLRRLLLFAKNALLTRAWLGKTNTLVWLWIEAGYDMADAPDT